MKISIIIPVYNVAEFIERCLLSALNQTYSDIEIILVNDATPDSGIETAETIIQKHPRKESVKIIHHPENKGLAAARNTGIKHASGDYIFFLDGDDEISKDCIEILSVFTKDNSIDLIIGEIAVIGNKRKAYPPLLLEDGIYHGNDFISNAFFQKQWYEMAWNKLIKKNFLAEKKMLFTEGLLHEDTLWSFQLALQIHSIAVIHAETYFYHIQKNSITQKKSPKNMNDFLLVLEKTIRLSQEKHLFETSASIFSYLENLRIYFIKSLLRNNFSENYISDKKKELDNLFNHNVWRYRKQSFVSKIKETVLNIQAHLNSKHGNTGDSIRD
ncbi:MAG: glycosyltransferase [Dysgonamonadaceae bacterium]|jgi:glycosyltransferase involved in cell wall biosynthesis|nr:glycosyltransferase [Dysgonamonadaceae bacterium]